jgi:hypothetical protein
MRRYRELVTDPAWRAEQEQREAVKLERFVRRLVQWDGESERLPEIPHLSRSKISTAEV